MSNFNSNVIPFKLNLRKEKWLLVSMYKPPFQSNNYFLKSFNDLLDFKSVIYDLGSCIDLIVTNRKYCFKNISSYETKISDHHHLKYFRL